MNSLKSMFFFSFALLTSAGCDDDNEKNDPPMTNVAGLTVKNSTSTFDDTYNTIKTQILAKNFNVIAEVDHQVAAAKVNLTLRPTRVIIFGNPKGGTLLMQKNQRIGIDLPLKILVRENDQKEIEIAYYNASTLVERYQISADQLVEKVNGALDGISGGTTNAVPNNLEADVESLAVHQSDQSASATFERLEAVLVEKDFNIIAKVEHDQAAASVGLDLRPTKVIIFGKPQVGTQLMQSNNQIGIDLPQKMLVWEDENAKVWIGYYPASFMANRHQITDKEGLVNKINMVQKTLVDLALSGEK